MKLDRRRFLKLSAASVGAVAFAGRAAALRAPWAVPRKWYAGEVRTVFSYCENCFWKCGIAVKVEGGRVRKIDGQKQNPKSRGR
ncbi:twin-arginine translocation signal domain-containing protein, partial [Oceanithermus sp.]